MLEIYFESPYTLCRLRSGPLGNYINGFAQALKDRGNIYGEHIYSIYL